MTCWYYDKPGHKKSKHRKCKRYQKTPEDKGDKRESKKEEQDITTDVTTSDIFFIGDNDHRKLACEDRS